LKEKAKSVTLTFQFFQPRMKQGFHQLNRADQEPITSIPFRDPRITPKENFTQRRKDAKAITFEGAVSPMREKQWLRFGFRTFA
jgi:hypothetical protein